MNKGWDWPLEVTAAMHCMHHLVCTNHIISYWILILLLCSSDCHPSEWYKLADKNSQNIKWYFMRMQYVGFFTWYNFHQGTTMSATTYISWLKAKQLPCRLCTESRETGIWNTQHWHTHCSWCFMWTNSQNSPIPKNFMSASTSLYHI